MGNEIKPNISCGLKIPKNWGEELIIENNDFYCGKILRFKAACKCSMQYHLKKDETWYILSGKFIFRWIDTIKGEKEETILKIGDIVRNYPGQIHQLEALEAGEIFEISTKHEDSDTYRIGY
jgi:mannose-6-phosphate isomerase